MSETKPNVPKLRFPGFTGPWEQRKLGEVGKARSGVGFPEAEQGGETGIPFFKVSDMNRPGNELEMISSSNYVTNEQIYRRRWKPIESVPAMLFAKVGAAVLLNRKRLVNTPFLLDNNTMAYSFNSSEWDAEFGAGLFETINLPSLCQVGALPSYNASDVEKVKISLPSLPEQRAIGAFFRDLDDLITLRQRELDHTKLMKRGLLQKMFPRAGADVPELRLPGFTNPWEQRKLGQLYERNVERNTCGFGADRTLSVATMTFNEGGNGADEASLPTYKVIRVGDVAFEGHTNREFAYGRFVVNTLADGIMSPRFSCLRPKFGYPVSFWKYYLHNERVMRRILVRSTKRGTMMNELVPDDLFSQGILVPSEKEQRLIGSFFRDLDDLITLRQRELDHAKLLKKALLQQMFV